ASDRVAGLDVAGKTIRVAIVAVVTAARDRGVPVAVGVGDLAAEAARARLVAAAFAWGRAGRAAVGGGVAAAGLRAVAEEPVVALDVARADRRSAVGRRRGGVVAACSEQSSEEGAHHDARRRHR